MHFEKFPMLRFSKWYCCHNCHTISTQLYQLYRKYVIGGEIQAITQKIRKSTLHMHFPGLWVPNFHSVRSTIRRFPDIRDFSILPMTPMLKFQSFITFEKVNVVLKISNRNFVKVREVWKDLVATWRNSVLKIFLSYCPMLRKTKQKKCYNISKI